MQETRQLIIYSLDKVASAYLTGEKGMDKLTFLMDWQNVSWENLDAQTLLAGLQTLQNYFPERLALMVMWKPPLMFWLMYKVRFSPPTHTPHPAVKINQNNFQVKSILLSFLFSFCACRQTNVLTAFLLFCISIYHSDGDPLCG